MEVKTTSSWFLIMIIVELLIFFFLSFPVASQVQSPEDFISIDCGGEDGWDPNTKLDWQSDKHYLQIARKLDRENVTVKATVELPIQTRVDNEKQLKTALVFYPGNLEHDSKPSKYCYELPAFHFNASAAPLNYLLRATFPTRNLKTTATDSNGGILALNAFSTRFYFTVDSTYVSTVELEDRPQVVELVISALHETVYVCLVPLEDRSSMPAISALEMRPFKEGMYPKSYDYEKWGPVGPISAETSYLMLFARWDFGHHRALPSVRYPDDIYDRIWSSPEFNSSQSSDISFETNTTSINVTGDVRYDFPEKVYSTAWVGKSSKSIIAFPVNLTGAGAQTPTFYLNLLFCDILDSSNDTRYIDIFYDPGNGMQPYFLGLKVRNGGTRVNHKGLTLVSDNMTFTVRANASSELPVLINGLEMYGEFQAVMARTDTGDVVATTNFSPDVLDKAGDPCLPTPWAWLHCSMEVPPRVTDVNLTNKGFDGDLPRLFELLDHLTVLDLSRNSFSGGLPLSLEDIRLLRDLKLDSNKLSGELPQFRSKSFQNLETLSLAHNQLHGNLSSLINALDGSLSYLSLANNSFTGRIPLEIEELTNLQDLDVSFNKLSGKLEIDLLKLNLRKLNLNNNSLDGTIPDSVWSSSSLKTANFSVNNFTVLNLTSWYLSAKAAESFDKCEACRKVQLVGNPIHDIIIPSLHITVPPPSYTNPAAFILLGGSPWCNTNFNPNSPDTTLIAGYLCRSNEHDEILLYRRQDGFSNKKVIAISVISGLLVLFMACVSIFLLWKTRKRTFELHQIQEALAKENVKPPFFNYSDLKTATRSFSENSILGFGGFGTVYKAELPDGSVLAVKRLNPTEQNVSDFLKEMVNITGIKHRHLIQLKGCCVREKQQRMLVYEYAENKSLAEALWGPEKTFVLSWKQRFNICLGIARGLAYLHEELQPKMVHRDIKPQNILLDKEYNAKIADFGLIRPTLTDYTQITSNIGGTRGYCSPEYMNEGMVSDKLDVYSYGVVVLEIVSGRVCINFDLPGDRIFLRSWALELYEDDQLMKLVDPELAGEYNEEEVLLVIRTAVACCQLDAKKRPTMTQVVNIFMKHADVAIEVVREMKGQKPQLGGIMEDDNRENTTYEADDAVYSRLLSMNSTSSVEGRGIDLSVMRPR